MSRQSLDILVISDQKDDSERIRNTFLEHSRDNQVKIVKNLSEAKIEISLQKPDLIISKFPVRGGRITDLMPKKVTEKIPPFLIISNNDLSNIPQELKVEGAVEHITHSEEMINRLPEISERVLRGWRVSLEKRKAEEYLREVEQRLYSVIQTTPVILWAIDTKGMITVSEGKGLTGLGLKSGQIVGCSVYEVYKDYPEALDAIRHALSGNEFTQRISVGDRIWENSYYPRINGEGDIEGLVGISFDITDRMKAEEGRIKSDEKYRSIVESAAEMILTTNTEGIIQFINKPASDHKREDIIGRSLYDFVPDESIDLVKEKIQYVLETGDFTGYEIYGLDGHYYDVRVGALKQDGKVVGLTLIAADRTIRRKAQKALEFRLKFESLISSISTRFINLKYDEIDTAIKEDIKILVEFFSDVDKGALCFFSEDRDSFSARYQWGRQENGNGSMNDSVDLLCSVYPFLMNKIKEGKSCFFEVLDDLPLEANVDRKRFSKEKVLSAAIVPLFSVGKVIGFLKLDSLRTQKEWSEDVVALLRVIGESFCSALVRKERAILLRKSEAQLRQQKDKLEQKNAALNELLEQIEIEKKQIKDSVVLNVDKLLMPTLRKLRLKGMSKKYIDVLSYNLEELSSTFGKRISEISVRLTSREIEICNLIRSGMTSKEIAVMLSISPPTIERHRANIRKKLNISNKEINLSSYLKTL